MFIPFQYELRECARELRNNQTPAEQIFWKSIRDRKILGYRFTRQKPLLSYIADFYCKELELVIEFDGSSHHETHEADTLRTIELETYGITVIRYTNKQVQTNLPLVLQDLKYRITTLANSPPF